MLEFKLPGGPLQYRPGQWPDGVYRNPYGEPEGPKNVRNPDSMNHFNNLVVKYYDLVKRGLGQEAEMPLAGPEAAMRILNFSEMPSTVNEVNEAWKGLLLYAHPDKNTYLDIDQYSKASNLISRKLQEAKDILVAAIEAGQ